MNYHNQTNQNNTVLNPITKKLFPKRIIKTVSIIFITGCLVMMAAPFVAIPVFLN